LPQDDSASPVTIGEIVAGKYRVERVLGQGGMGVVVAALHIELDQRVALKFLRPHATAHPHVVARFAREARAAAKIHSEHVVRVIDVGVLPTGAPYVVMEFMDGEDLARILLRRGPLSMEVATGYVLETCEAIAEAHALGIVHRDLKPANLFLARRTGGRPIVKVLDFGISKSLSASSQGQLTKTTAVVGSPLYMSPEQLMSAKSVDVRSDIWALGVVLYELLTARMPFEGDTLPEVIAAVLHREHEPLRSVRPELPPALDAIIRRCLAKDVAARFVNVAEFAAAVAPFGPAQSEASVERIVQVLGLGDPPPPSAGAGNSPLALTVVPTRLGVSGPHPDAAEPAQIPMERTLPLAAKGAYPVATATTATTSKPVSTEEPLLPAGVPSGTYWLVPALAVGGLLVGIGIAATAWRPLLSHRAQAVAPNSSSTPSISQRVVAPPLSNTASVAQASLPTPSISRATRAVANATEAYARGDSQEHSDKTLSQGTADSRGASPQSPSASAPALSATSTPPIHAASVMTPWPANSGEQAFLNINSIPVSSVILDGMPIGSTPKVKFPVSPGSHSILFVNADQGFKKQISVAVEPGETKGAIGSAN
jgi:eukaryotic-like serine/threonine-protein kinase